MNSCYPPFRELDSLPRAVLCLAPHADDEVIGCGGVLAFHAARGDRVRILVLTDGSRGDPGVVPDGAPASRLSEVRRGESLAAGADLGLTDHRFLGFEDGALAARADLVDRLAAEIEAFAPEAIYCPSPQEMHVDHRAASHALVAALQRAPGTVRRLLFYGVNAQVQATALYDTTRFWPAKRRALGRFESQLVHNDIATKCEALDRARTVNVEDPAVTHVEGFADVAPAELARYQGRAHALLECVQEAPHGRPGVTAVISTWNKREVVRENLLSLRAQSEPFAAVVVVDNASSDGTARMIADEFPEVRLIVMPHDRYGACETFNIGFASVTTPLLAILDDDITLPLDWVRKTVDRLLLEPETTAIVSTKIVEPGMPESYKSALATNRERYMSTFRGCGSLARAEALRRAGFYDERLFIYGNERDLTCRLLNLGYRVLQYPQVETYHKTPFGIQMGRRSLFYHARNAWLSMLKYAPLGDLLRMPYLVVTRVLLRRAESEERGEVSDATGTIGIGKSLRHTPGASWILAKAVGSILYNVPYCLKRRQPVHAEDFELPLH